MWIEVISLPLISAVIGWFTNYLAVKMLFRPKEKVKIGFIEFQGIFPKRQAMVAAQIGKMVANELISVDDIQEQLHRPENLALIHEGIERKIDNYLNDVLPGKYPLIAIFFTTKVKGKIKDELMGEVEQMAPEMIQRVVLNIEQSFDVESIITEKITQLSTDKLESLIMGILNKEFKFIEYIGAVVGFFIGLVQVLIVYLLK